MALYSETSKFKIQYFDQTFTVNHDQMESFANQVSSLLRENKPRFLFLPVDDTETEEWQFSMQILVAPGVSLSIREVRGE